MNKTAIIIFVKNPVLGHVKTRLAKTIGDEKALSIYLMLLKHTESQLSKLPYDKFVYYDQEIVKDDIWDNKSFGKLVQSEGNLGERMSNAFQEIFNKDYSQVLIIGSDCYQLRSSHINQAVASLRSSEVVIGPANDGGYYLLGMNSFRDVLFRDKSWSTDRLLEETTYSLNQSNISFKLLETLIDIDTIDDLQASGISL